MKKESRIQSGLLIQPPSSALVFGPNSSDRVRAEIIFSVTGFDDAALRRAPLKNYFPSPIRARYDLQKTITGIVKFFRERLEANSLTLPRFDTMEACEGAGYFSKRFLQTLKSAGLPGFENTRVDLNKIIPALECWLASTPEGDRNLLAIEGVRSFQEMGEKYRAKTAKVEYETAQGDRIAKAVAIDCLRVNQSIHHGSYDRMIEELPAQLAGRDAATIRKILIETAEAIRRAEDNEIAALEQKNNSAINHAEKEISK